MPNRNEVEAWYASLKRQMEEKGYNMSDPYTLGLFQVLPDFSDDDVYNMEDDNVNTYSEKIKQYMKDYNLSRPERSLMYTENMHPAFTFTSVGEGEDQHMEPIPFDHTNYAEFLNKNTVTEPSYELKEFLYQKAQVGKLCIQYDGFELNQPMTSFINAKGGEAQILQNLDLSAKKKNATMEKFNMDENTFKTFSGNFTALADISNLVLTDLTGHVDAIKGGKITEKRKIELVEAFTDKMKWYNTKRLVCVAGKNNPGVFNDPKSKELLNDCAQIGSKCGTYLTEKEKKIADKGLNCFMSPIYNPMLNKLKKKLGKDFTEIIKDGVFDERGNQIKAESVIDCMNALGNQLSKGRELYINQKVDDKVTKIVYVEDLTFKSVSKTTSEGAYISEINNLKDELLKTESSMSMDSTAYKNLKEALIGFSGRVEAERDKIKEQNSKYASEKDYIDAELNRIAKLAKVYQDNHANNWNLSYRQHDRLSVASKIQCLVEKRTNGDLFPQDLKTKLAEKLVLEQAAAYRKSGKSDLRKEGLKIFTNHDSLVRAMNAMKNNKEFEVLANQQPEVLKAMLKAPKGQLFEGYSDLVRHNNMEKIKENPQKQEDLKVDRNSMIK